MNNDFGYYEAEITRKLGLVLGNQNLTGWEREMIQGILDVDLVGLAALLKDAEDREAEDKQG